MGLRSGKGSAGPSSGLGGGIAPRAAQEQLLPVSAKLSSAPCTDHPPRPTGSMAATSSSPGGDIRSPWDRTEGAASILHAHLLPHSHLRVCLTHRAPMITSTLLPLGHFFSEICGLGLKLSRWQVRGDEEEKEVGGEKSAVLLHRTETLGLRSREGQEKAGCMSVRSSCLFLVCPIGLGIIVSAFIILEFASHFSVL